jgi:putative nucleotidyltransferase with HDIG domain
MWRNVAVSLSDLLFSVSEVMDLADESLVDHQVRTAFVASEMARAARLDYAQTERLLIAALLHDIGALSPEEKVGTHAFEIFHPESHCRKGATLFREAFWLEPSAHIVEWHHTPMAAHEREGRKLTDEDTLSAQILFLADHLERAIRRDTYILHQSSALRSRMHGLSGEKIHAEVLSLFDRVSSPEEFWLSLVSKDLALNMRRDNLLRSIPMDYEAAQSIASVLKDMTDFRSRFTATHSAGVAACACALARVLAFSGKDLQQIELAGLMHDVGKLVVPNHILYKPGALTPAEIEVVRQHPYFTYRILSGVRGFEQIAEWAGFHHERLNGSGYCKHLTREELDLGAKVIATADVATAIAENRPYRQAGNKETVLRTLRDEARSELLEPRVVEALIDNYDSIMENSAAMQSADEARYVERYSIID